VPPPLAPAWNRQGAVECTTTTHGDQRESGVFGEDASGLDQRGHAVSDRRPDVQLRRYVTLHHRPHYSASFIVNSSSTLASVGAGRRTTAVLN